MRGWAPQHHANAAAPPKRLKPAGKTGTPTARHARRTPTTMIIHVPIKLATKTTSAVAMAFESPNRSFSQLMTRVKLGDIAVATTKRTGLRSVPTVA
jgi:hypothetical protein